MTTRDEAAYEFLYRKEKEKKIALQESLSFARWCLWIGATLLLVSMFW